MTTRKKLGTLILAFSAISATYNQASSMDREIVPMKESSQKSFADRMRERTQKVREMAIQNAEEFSDYNQGLIEKRDRFMNELAVLDKNSEDLENIARDFSDTCGATIAHFIRLMVDFEEKLIAAKENQVALGLTIREAEDYVIALKKANIEGVEESIKIFQELMADADKEHHDVIRPNIETVNRAQQLLGEAIKQFKCEVK